MIKVDVLKNGSLLILERTVSDSVKFEKIKFTFPESWKGFTKTAVFRNGENVVEILLNADSDYCIGKDECFVPFEVIKPPFFTVSVFGSRGDTLATTVRAEIEVLESGYELGDFPQEPTQSIYSQILDETQKATQIAQSVRDDADNGKLKGDKGEKGDKGDKGDPGAQGIQGIQGEPGKDAVTDQNFDPQSENAQSGKALAVEFNKKADRNKILDYIVYTVDTGKEEVIITDCDMSISGSHSIPDIIEGYPVTNINPDAFKGCTSLENLVIPDNVTRIGSNAFENCYKLVNITMPKHLDNIQDYVFEGCEILKHIYIPDTLTYIDSYAFAESSIEHIYFEGSKEQWESICDGLEESEGITIHYNQRPATVDYVNSKLGDIETLLGGI